jgi:hypothetical protein
MIVINGLHGKINVGRRKGDSMPYSPCVKDTQGTHEEAQESEWQIEGDERNDKNESKTHRRNDQTELNHHLGQSPQENLQQQGRNYDHGQNQGQKECHYGTIDHVAIIVIIIRIDIIVVIGQPFGSFLDYIDNPHNSQYQYNDQLQQKQNTTKPVTAFIWLNLRMIK